MARNAGPANKGLLKLAFRHPSSPDIDKRDAYETKKLPNGSLLKKRERVDKPGSVVGRPFISNARHRASQARNPNARKGGRMAFLFALAPDGVFQATLLPTRWCALTAPFQLFSRLRGGVYFSVALSVGSPRPAVSWHLALWSPDFLTPLKAARDRLARSQCGILPYRNRNKEHHDNLRIGWRHIFQRTRFHGTL